MFLKSLIFKILKICTIFVGSVHNFGKSEGDIIQRKNAYFHWMHKYVVSCPTQPKNLERSLMAMLYSSIKVIGIRTFRKKFRLPNIFYYYYFCKILKSHQTNFVLSTFVLEILQAAQLPQFFFFCKKRRKVNSIQQQPKTGLFEGYYKLNRINIT